MAFTPVPSTWLGAGYNQTGNTVVFNTNAGSPATLAQLTNALADETTGDIRSIIMAFAEAFFQAALAQGTGNQATKMTITRSTSTGPTNTTVFTYTFKFTVDATEFSVASE